MSDLGGKVKHEPKRISVIIKKNSIFKDSTIKVDTLSILKNDKEAQELIKPKFKILSNVNISRPSSYPFEKKSSTYFKKIQPDDKGKIVLPTTLKPVSEKVTQEHVPILMLNHNNEYSKIQNCECVNENNLPIEVVKNNNMLSPTEYVKDPIVHLNINMTTNEKEISEQVGVKNNIFPQQDNIPTKSLKLPGNANSWELIRNTNILRNTKYILVKKDTNAFANSYVLTNNNLTENQNFLQTESFKASVMENFPNEDVDAENNTLFTNKINNNKLRSTHYSVQTKNPITKRKIKTQTRKRTKIRRGKNSVPKYFDQNNIGISKIQTSFNNTLSQENHLMNNTPTSKTTNNFFSDASSSTQTITDATNSTPIAQILNAQNFVSSLAGPSIPINSQKTEIINADGKTYLLVPLNNVVTVQRNPMQPSTSSELETDKNYYTLVPLDNIQTQKNNNATEVQMKSFEPVSQGIQMVEETVFPDVPMNNVTKAKKVIIKRKNKYNTDEKTMDATMKNEPPVIIHKNHKASKYDALIAKYSQQKMPFILPKETQPIEDISLIDTTSPSKILNDKVYTEIINKFPLILPKEVSNNSEKQSDILEKAIASINMDEFMLDKEINMYKTNSLPIYTQSLDRNALSSDQRANMFYNGDPMLPQYSIRNL